jgi:hypothetical protein
LVPPGAVRIIAERGLYRGDAGAGVG